jgi:hypothetical protein
MGAGAGEVLGQETFDWERLYSLNWGASGTVPKSGSIDGITISMKFVPGFLK